MASTITLPSNVEAERTVLGAMLIDSKSAASGYASLNEDSFSGVDPRNGMVFKAISEILSRRENVDIQSVHDQLVNLKLDKEVGSPEYLKELIDCVISVDNTDHYINIVKNQAVLKQLLIATQQIQNEYQSDGVTDIGDFVSKAAMTLVKIANSKATEGFKNAGEVATKVVTEIETRKESSNRQLTGVDTGYKKLNHFTHGWQKGELVIVAARPSVGKTALTMNFALNAAYLAKVPVGFFSLEMSSESILTRLLAAVSGVSNEHIQTAYLEKDEKDKLVLAANKIQQLNFYIDDTPNAQIGDIVAKATRLKNEHPELGLIVVDYLGIIKTSKSGKNNDNRQLEVAEVVGELKALARNLDIPVIVCAQLNREVDANPNGKPKLSNLRESGSIEQDADKILLLSRGDYHDKANEGKDKTPGAPTPQPGSLGDAEKVKTPPNISVLNIDLAKNRNGQTGELILMFDKSISLCTTPTQEFEDAYFQAIRFSGQA